MISIYRSVSLPQLPGIDDAFTAPFKPGARVLPDVDVERPLGGPKGERSE